MVRSPNIPVSVTSIPISGTICAGGGQHALRECMSRLALTRCGSIVLSASRSSCFILLYGGDCSFSFLDLLLLVLYLVLSSSLLSRTPPNVTPSFTCIRLLPAVYI